MKYEEKLSAMIQCETVSQNGKDNLEKFEAFQAKLRELFPRVFSDSVVEVIKGNLLVCYKSKAPKGQPIILMSHQDVVEATGDWKYPPFSGEIAEGNVWGRGTVDTKGALFCIFQALEEVIEEGIDPGVDVYIASSCTEEIAGEGGPLLAARLKELGVKAQFLMDEGGMIKGEPIKGAKGTFAMIGVLEKGTCNFKFVAKGQGGHASAPGHNTPIPRLAAFIDGIEKKDPFKAKMNATTIEMFRRLGPTISGPLGFLLRHAKGFSPLLEKVLPKSNPLAGAMIKTTIAFTTSGAANGLNVLPETAFVTGNCRVIHHCDENETERILKELAAPHDIEVIPLYKSSPCPVVSYKCDQFKLLEKTIKKVFPDVTPCPYAMTGGTDARFYSEVSDACLRFAPLEINEQQYKSIHGLNENIGVETLKKGVLCYKELIKAFQG
jgi:Acetylornithine deacetylase/Succinyl-diaminopimelate desuccinylase and related deacylases